MFQRRLSAGLAAERWLELGLGGEKTARVAPDQVITGRCVCQTTFATPKAATSSQVVMTEL
jgi:hypothetical protein